MWNSVGGETYHLWRSVSTLYASAELPWIDSGQPVRWEVNDENIKVFGTDANSTFIISFYTCYYLFGFIKGLLKQLQGLVIEIVTTNEWNGFFSNRATV